MRVIAGSARGVRLHPIPPGLSVRPTLDRVREALFSILMPRIEDARFLDLFAGSGANGIEALSRGAAEAVFVDSDPKILALIRQNLAKTRLHERGRCLGLAMPGQVGKLQEHGPFDIVYCDPPHSYPDYQGLISELSGAAILEAGGVLIVEHATKCLLPDTMGQLTRSRVARYGSTTLSFYT